MASGDWREWSQFVLKAIEKLEGKMDQLDSDFHEQQILYKEEITQLKTKVKFAAAIVGLVSSIGVSVISGLLVWWLTSSKIDDKVKNIPQQYYQQQHQPSRQPYPNQYYPNNQQHYKGNVQQPVQSAQQPKK